MGSHNLLGSGPSRHGPTVDFNGRWENQLGSWMGLTISNSSVTGEYHSKVSSSGGWTIGDIAGWVDGDIIGIVVNWRDFVSITAWTGQLVSHGGSDLLKTLWLLTKDVEGDASTSEEDELWAATLVGADNFSRA